MIDGQVTEVDANDVKEENTTTNNTVTEVSKTEASDIQIELLNGSGSKETLTKIKKELQKIGYNVINSTTTTSTAKTTIINKTDVDTQFTDNIKEVLGVGNVSTSSVSSNKVDITIIIGKDYNEQ